MRVVLKRSPFVSSSYTGPSREYYLYPVPVTDNVVQDHINAWDTPEHDGERRAYARALRTEQAWRIAACTTGNHGSWPSTPFIASMFEVKDAEDNGQVYQVTRTSGIPDLLQFKGPLGYGKTFQGIPTVSGSSRYVAILEGPHAGMVVLHEQVAPYSDKIVNNWKEVVAKVVDGTGHDILCYMDRYFVKLAYNDQLAAKNLYMAHPQHSDVYVRPSMVEFPADDAVKLVYERKATVAYELVVHEKVKTSVISSAGAFANALAYMQVQGGLQVQLANYGTSLSNYWNVDPADYTKATYLPQAKVAAVLAKGEDPWTSTMRQSTSWAKLIRGQMNPAIFRESQFENFGTHMVSLLGQLYGPEDIKPQLVVVSGPDIAKYYSQDYYMEKRGDLGGSCMRHVSPSFFDMYVKNPECISMLIIKDRNKDAIYGRAILWKGNDGINYIDRRYTVSPVETAKMMNWAKENNYVDLWGGHHSPKAGVQVTLKNPYHKLYPYMDSMCHLDVDTGILSSVEPSGKKTSMVKDTSGHRNTLSHEVPCVVSSIYAPAEKMQKTVSGSHAFPEFLEQIRGGRYELKNLVITDDLEGGKISKSESITLVVEGKKKVATKCSPKVVMVSADTFLLKEDAVYSKSQGMFIPKKDAVQASDGTYCYAPSLSAYEAKLAQKRQNKARMVPTRETAQAAVAV
jgi:hypothetical protein